MQGMLISVDFSIRPSFGLNEWPARFHKRTTNIFFDHRDLYPFVWMPSTGRRSDVAHNVIKDRSLQLSFARLRVRFYKVV